jgi:hypothetical protein
MYLRLPMPQQTPRIGDRLTGPLFGEPVRVVTGTPHPDGTAEPDVGALRVRLFYLVMRFIAQVQ